MKKIFFGLIMILGILTFSNANEIDINKNYYKSGYVKSIFKYHKKLQIKIKVHYYDNDDTQMSKVSILYKNKLLEEHIIGKNGKGKCYIEHDYIKINKILDSKDKQIVFKELSSQEINDFHKYIKTTKTNKYLECKYNAINLTASYKFDYFLDDHPYKYGHFRDFGKPNKKIKNEIKMENLINKYYRIDKFTLFGFDTGL